MEAAECDTSSGMEQLTKHFMEYLSSLDEQLPQYVPHDYLELIIRSLRKLHKEGVSNVLYLLAKALLGSPADTEQIGTQSLAFNVLQLMLVSYMDTPKNQTKLLNGSCDIVVNWIFAGLADDRNFVTHVNKLLFPGKNLEFRYTPVDIEDDMKCALSVVRSKDSSVQCQYMDVNVPLSEVKLEPSELTAFTEKNTIAINLQGEEENLCSESGKKKEQCPECGKWVISLKDHEVVHSKELRNKCPLCGEKFLYRVQKKKHLEKSHPYFSKEDIKEREKTMKANKGVISSENLVAPQIAEVEVSDVVQGVEICKEHELRSILPKKEVDNEDHDDEASMFESMPELDTIGSSIMSTPKLTKVKMATGSVEKESKKKKLKCKECGLWVVSLKDHQVVHTKVPRYKCHLCDKKFLYRVQKRVHLKKEHAEFKQELKKSTPLSTSTCNICFKKFSTFHVMQRHKRQFHKLASDNKSLQGSEGLFVPDYSCTTCGHLCISEEVLDKHIEKKICKRCSFCDMAFETRKELIDHKIATHVIDDYASGLEDFCCGLCGSSKPSYDKLKNHFRTSPNCLACLQCNETFLTKEELKNHRESHTTKVYTMVCAICQKRFRNDYYLQCHIKDVHGDVVLITESASGAISVQASETPDLEMSSESTEVKEEKAEAQTSFPCEFCDKVFDNQKEYKKHKKVKHWKEDTGGNLCTICGARFREKSELKDHENVHNGLKPYKCTLCDATMATNAAFRGHMWRHRNGKIKALCDLCGKECANKMSLKGHMTRYHGIVSEKFQPFKCKHCDTSFLKKRALGDHLRNVHGDKPDALPRKFECKECGRMFSSKGNLRDHGFTHKRIKRFYCELCGEGFIHRSAMKRHVIKHKGLKSFECPVCKRLFDCYEYMARHAKLQHKGVQYSLPEFKNPPSHIAKFMKDPDAKGIAHEDMGDQTVGEGDEVAAAAESIDIVKEEQSVSLIVSAPEQAKAIVADYVYSDVGEEMHVEQLVLPKQSQMLDGSDLSSSDMQHALVSSENLVIDNTTSGNMLSVDQTSGSIMGMDDNGSTVLLLNQGEGKEQQVIYLPQGTSQVQIGNDIIQVATSSDMH